MNSDDDILVQPTEVILTPPPPSNTNISGNVKTTRKKGLFIFVLEPAVFLIFFAMNLSGAVFQTQVIYQTCTNIFGFNKTDCAVLGMETGNERSQEIELIVQPYAAKIFMTRTLLDSIVPAICSLFIGPWSDRFGRKPVILCAFTGYFLGYLILSVIAFLSDHYFISPWAYVVAAIPSSVLGGLCGLIAGVLCYIADVSVPNRRAFRMVMLEASIYLGLMIGSLLSSHLLLATNVVTVFLISGCFVFASIIYVIMFLDESVSSVDQGSKIRELFKWALLKDMFKTCFEKRPNYDRAIIWLTMLVLAISIFAMDGNSTIFYLFVMEKFQWTLQDYTTYDAVGIVIIIVGNVVGMYILQRIFRLSITSLALLAMGSQVLDSIIKATASYSWQLYLSTSVGFLKGISGPMCRAILSHITPTSDLGKIMSFTTALESISPLGSAPLYTSVYSATITWYPGFFNFISCFLYLICYIFLVIVFGIQISFRTTSVYEAIGS